MKAHKQLTAGIAVAIIAVLVASQSVNQAAGIDSMKYGQINKVSRHRLYSNEEVELLMNANHWTRQEALEVLDLSLQKTN